MDSERGGASDVAVHHLADGYVVVELHEVLTAPGPALELHVVQDAESGASIASWEDDGGRWLGKGTVGRG
jgi:hypothetical protein